MKLSPIFSFLIIVVFSGTPCSLSTDSKQEILESKLDKKDAIKKLWSDSKLQKEISFDLFQMTMFGFNGIDQKKKDRIVIIDYSKPSTDKRFYVIDLYQKKLLFKCLVAHGRNSGTNYATDFSNKSRSLKSSLGFFLTGETYLGKHGYSLKMDGLETSINDNARKRSIVIHGADYVSQDFIKNYGRLGRSWGCPALPMEMSQEIIDSISNGRCIFIFSNDTSYFQETKFIK